MNEGRHIHEVIQFELVLVLPLFVFALFLAAGAETGRQQVEARSELTFYSVLLGLLCYNGVVHNIVGMLMMLFYTLIANPKNMGVQTQKDD